MFVEVLFRQPAYFISVVVIIIASITIHELFHALAAYSQGDDTPVRAGRLTLNPLAHMGVSSIVLLVLMGLAWWQTPVTPSRFRHGYSAALVSFAGPFANICLMVGSVALARFLHPLEGFEAWVDFFSLAAMLNAFLFLLNMLPIPPLDGFGILETFIPPLRPYAISLSQYGFFLLLVLFLFMNLGGVLLELARQMVGYVSLMLAGVLG